jgi:hypothetical protein
MCPGRLVFPDVSVERGNVGSTVLNFSDKFSTSQACKRFHAATKKLYRENLLDRYLTDQR